MSPRLHCLRKTLHVALAALVMTASLHCAWEARAALTQIAIAAGCRASGQSLPIGFPCHECDNESGCICRGATLVHAVDVTGFQAHASDLLPADLAPQPIGYVTGGTFDARSGAIQHDFAVPPISGRQLRALYASLVI